MNFVAALLAACSSSVLVATVLAFVRGGLTPATAGLALACGGVVAAGVLWQGRSYRPQWRALGGWEWAAVVLFSAFSLRAFLWLIFQDGDEIKVLSPNNLGDLSLHLTYIHQLANGVRFWPENPICSGAWLTYPLGADLFNALLVLVGVDTFRGLIWVGLAGCVCTGLALWRWGGAFVLVGFLCNGGLFGFAIFSTGYFSDFQAEMAWKSIPLALFVTQRGLLFALPAGLLLMSSWRSRFQAAAPGEWRLPRWVEVLLYASMPVFHLHTFLFLSVLLAVWFVFLPAARRTLAITVGAAFLPATILVLLVTGRFSGAAVLDWKLGWMWDDPAFTEYVQNSFGPLPAIVTGVLFWVLNFGVLPFLVAWLCSALFWEEDSVWARATLFPALAVFAVCCFVKFAPWEWDNTKLMIWSYLSVIPFLWTHLLSRWPMRQRFAACVLLFFSGFVSLLGGVDRKHTGYKIAQRSELDPIASAVRLLPANHRFASFPTYNHPLLLLGRPVALGYAGHVWSHGLPWQKPAARLEALMNGAPQWREHATALDVRYLFWGAEERANYPDSAQPWRSDAALVASGEWGEIYDLASTASPAGE